MIQTKLMFLATDGSAHETKEDAMKCNLNAMLVNAFSDSTPSPINDQVAIAQASKILFDQREELIAILTDGEMKPKRKPRKDKGKPRWKPPVSVEA